MALCGPLVIILVVDFGGAFAEPAECDAVVSRHEDRPAFWVAMQTVKMKPRDVHVLGPLRYFQQLQDAYALPYLVGTNPASSASAVKLFNAFVPEAADHGQSVNILVYSVKSRVQRGLQDEFGF